MTTSLCDVDTETTTCCGARATYSDDVLVCKACWGEVEWARVSPPEPEPKPEPKPRPGSRAARYLANPTRSTYEDLYGERPWEGD